jgi:hypothetical protein
MDGTTNLTDFDALVLMPGDEYERLARIREHQRRERKEELYSYRRKNHKVCK